MFETLPQFSMDTVLIAARAVLLIGAFWVFGLAFIRWRRADERNTQLLHEQFTRAFNELRSLHETVAVMSARLEALGEHAEGDARRAPAPAVAATHRGYDVAQRMAKNGADAQALVASCGVTRHEAELLVRLHGTKNTAAAPQAAWSPAPVSQNQSAHRPAQPTDRTAAVTWPQTAEAPLQPQPTATRKRGSLLSVVG